MIVEEDCVGAPSAAPAPAWPGQLQALVLPLPAPVLGPRGPPRWPRGRPSCCRLARQGRRPRQRAHRAPRPLYGPPVGAVVGSVVYVVEFECGLGV